MARLIDTILGHAPQKEDLSRRISDGRLAHALAFTGPAGIGKRMMAWAVAQALLCECETKPCGECGACLRVEGAGSENVLFLEPQGPQIKIEAAHQVLEFLSLRRLGAARLIIVNEAHLLNPQAGNALLKAVEEPPPETYFIFVVPEISQLLPTLRSRSQVLRFAPLPRELLARLVKPDAKPEIKPWMLNSVRGSAGRLGMFQDPELESLRKLVFEFIGSSMQGRRTGLENLLKETRDRESALQAIRFLQQGLRDWVWLGTGHEIHSDCTDLLRALPPWEAPHKMRLWRTAQQMEMDLAGNVDRALLFENFYYRARKDA